MKNKKYVKDFLWNMIGISLNSFLIMILLIIITRINGIEISGVFSFSFALCGVIQAISTYGGRNFQISDIKEEFSDNEYFSSKFVTSLISIIILCIYILLFKQDINTIILITLLMLMKIIETFSDVVYGIFQKKDNLDKVGKSYTLKNIIQIIVFLVIDYLTRNIIFSTIGMVIVNIMISVIYDYINIKKIIRLKININKNSFKVLKVSFSFFLYNFLILVITNISRFTVNELLSKEELGYYGILVMIPSVMTLFGQFVLNPSLLKLSKFNMNNEIKKFNKEIKNIFIQSILISGICILCAYFLGEQVLSILYNISFKGYKYIFILFIIIGLLNVFTLIISTSLTVMRKTKFQVFVYLSVLILGLLTSYYMTKSYGFNGSIISYIITMGVQFLIFLVYYLRVIKERCK